MELTLFALAVFLGLLGAASLVAKTEGYRGAGRVSGGLSSLLLGISLMLLSFGSHQLPNAYGVLSAVLALIGLGTVISGARKFARRNIQ